MQAIKRISAYWWCQVIGWGGNALMNFFYAWNFKRDINTDFVLRSVILAVLGLLLTHLMRWLIIRMNVMQKRIDQQIIYFVSLTIGFSVLYSVVSLSFLRITNLLSQEVKNFNFSSLLAGFAVNAAITLLVWNLIYFVYHYIERFRKQQIESLKAESLIRELQLQTIKSHINPHFIFNSLNSIRALVDENPGRARTAITELSNILRSSMQAEKAETVPFEKELNIVKDYLALEQMRFEERLKVKFEIDEDTLDMPVPPMMLQTLVENAIKHGVSKNVSGGEVTVISRFSDLHHELIVRNTGKLNGSYNAEGFGISSTMDRLKLMFGDKASFVLKNTNETHVEAVVQMPVQV
ncbi:MAG: histidine kinase [Chitinophagaceae bacterium]|nr:histidine kinase [Chitinophagaceae bacterium]